jgi:dihydrofolate synthase/folylpolyglutamate synthase
MISSKEKLNSWLAKLESSNSLGIDLSLDRVEATLNKLNILPFKCLVVTVAGTNGKGSTIYALENLLKSANKKVGSYTSPHLFEFNERVRIGGNEVSDDQLIEAFEAIDLVSDSNYKLTFFEFTTLAAFWIFSKASLDVILLEVGLGGRLDAVNCVCPDLAIITSIGLDHEEYLGNNLEDIAKEKAGIFRPNIPVLLGSSALQQSILNEAQKNSVQLYSITSDFKDFPNFDENNIKLPLESVRLALAAYTLLRNKLRELPCASELVCQLHGLRMQGRMQKINYNGVSIICDVAHNPLGVNWLKANLDNKCKRRIAVWTSAKDKNLIGIVEPMLNEFEEWLVPTVLNDRIDRNISIKTLKKLKANIDESVSCMLEVLKKASYKAKPNGEVVVFGSFFTVAEAIKIMNS